MKSSLPSIKILGTTVTTASKNDVLEYIFKRLQNKSKKFYIVTPNPEILMYASSNKEYKEVINRAEVSLPDGVGVLIAGRILKKGVSGRITGVDMMESICQEASKRHVTVGFLGGRGNVAKVTAECLTKKYPGLIVSFVGEEWPEESSKLKDQTSKTGSLVLQPATRNPQPISHIDILFVAFGFPKQEEWIAKNLDNLTVTCAMGVGGAFDYISGKVIRAPKFVQNVGMEWAFRLIRQPWRIRRQLALPLFATEVMRERIFPKKQV